MPLSQGTRIGHYDVTALLGVGGMGEVYRARDTKLHRDVALKVLPAAVARDPERMARFEREARVLASLNHPNIAALYGIEDSGATRALVMELVEGPTLADRLAAGPIPIDEALAIARQIVDAVEYAHDRGVIHRDLKPANVKVTPEGAVKVLDFGLAKALSNEPGSLDPQNSPTLTMGATNAGVILGTAAYMAPEQAKGKAVDRRADIWAFGVLLFEMLTGKPLFTGETAAEIMASAIKEEPKLERLPAEAPVPVRKLIERCLNKDPKQRLQAIGEARIVLAGPMEESGRGRDQEVPRRAGALPYWAVAAMATFAVLASALGFVAYRHAREEPERVVKLQFALPEKGSLVAFNPPAISPDGRRIVFSATVDGKQALWIRDLDSLSARILEGTEGGFNPFWSPDSRSVAFFAAGKLKKLDVAGGSVLTVCDSPMGRGGTWNQDDIILFTPDTISGLMRVTAAGGTPTPVTELEKARNEISHRWPWFLPDGRHFLYLARSTVSEQTAVYAGDLQSKERKLVVQAASNAVFVAPGELLFARDQTLMAQPFDAAKLRTTGDAVPVAEQVDFAGANALGRFTASQNGILAYSSGGGGDDRQITWFDRSGKAIGTVGKPGNFEWTSLSPDGKRVAADSLDPQSNKYDIWLYDLVRGTQQKLTFSGNNRFAIWSSDGTRITYRGDKGIVQKNANGTGSEEVLEAAPKVPTDWSRDGRYLLSTTAFGSPKTGADIWVHPQSGDRKAFAYLATEFNESYEKLSPDARWLAYVSNESKRNEIYVMSFPKPGGKWQISTNGGRIPVWSRDGRELYFVSADSKMMAVEIKPGAKFEAGVPKPLFDARVAGNNANFDVSADGRFLIATPVAESASVPMTVVLNWQAGLKK